MLTIRKNSENKFELLDDSTGLKITEEIFDEVQSFINLFVIIQGDFKSIFHISGKQLLKSSTNIRIEYHQSTNSLLYRKDDYWGITTQDGHHLSPICNSVKHGIINVLGNSFQFIVKTMDGQAIWDSKKGFLKKFFRQVSYPIQNLYVVRFNRHDHLIDYNFNFLIRDAQFINIDEKNKRIILKQNDLIDILDINLNSISTGFLEINPFLNGYSVSKKNNRCGIINVDCEWIEGYDSLDMDLDCYDVNELKLNEFITVKQNNLYGFFSTISKKHVKPFSRQSIEFLNGYAVVQSEENKFGLIDSKFNWVVPAKLLKLYLCVDFFIYDFDKISPFRFPYIAKHPDTLKYGLISHNGQWITEPNYDMIYYNENYSIEDAYLFYLKFDKGDEKGILTIFGTEIFREKLDWIENNFVLDDEDYDMNDFEYNTFINQIYVETNFKLESGFLYGENDIPTEGVRFPIIKDGANGYYDAFGVFHLL